EDIFIDYHDGGTYSAEADQVIAGVDSPSDGIEGDIENPWDDVYFYNSGTSAWEEDSDAIWQDDGNVYYDNGKDTHVAGVQTENLLGQNSMPTGWDLKFYDAQDDGGAWDDSVDMIVFEDDDNGVYGDAIGGVAIFNNGTADTTDIEAIELYMESNDEPGFQTGEGGDTHIGTFTTSDGAWVCVLSSPITLFGESKTFYVVANISGLARGGKTLQFEIPSDGILLNSTTLPEEDLVNANVITIGKLGVDYFEGTEDGAVDVIVTDTKEIKYDATVNVQINTSLLNPLLAGTAPADGTDGDTNNPWSNIYFYDGGKSGEWEGSSDAIWQDNGDGKYNSADDTLLAGTAPAEDTTGTDINPWSDIYFHDDGDDVWEEDSDAIWQDKNGDGKWEKSNDAVEYYLYYPCYKRVGSGGSYTYYIEWKPYMVAGGSEQASVTADGKVQSFAESIHFNVSGMWILDDDDPIDAAKGTDDNFAYFWVNGSRVYDMSLSTDKVYYGKNETITITVTEGGSAAGVWIDVRRESDGSLVFHKWAGDGTVTFNSDWIHNLTYAGNYTVFAYRDIDPTIIGYGTEGYSEDYGYTNPSITTSNYSAICGPWDPPEKISAVKKIVVKTGEPQLEIPETNRTMYWNFSGEVKIYVKGYDGKNLTVSDFDVKVYNSTGGDVTSYPSIDKSTPGVIKISCDSWGWDGTHHRTWGTTGTWKIVVSYDKPTADGTEEWNGTVTFTVTSAPDVQIKILNPEDKEIKA
ncbi:MAG: hypothetical protein DRP25_07160, partial [Thermotoga sp.]